MKRKPPKPLRYVTTTLELGEPPSEFSVPIAPWFEPDEVQAIEAAAKGLNLTPTQYVHRMACVMATAPREPLTGGVIKKTKAKVKKKKQ